MCSPAGIMVVSAVVSAYSAYRNQQAQNKQADYQAKVADNNALVAGYEGKYAKEMTAQKVAQQKQQVAQMVSKQRASMGATGLTVDSGSFMDLSLDTVEKGKLDELALLYEGDKAVWNAQVNAGNASAQAEAYRMSMQSPFMSALPALMSGASSAASMSYYASKTK